MLVAANTTNNPATALSTAITLGLASATAKHRDVYRPLSQEGVGAHAGHQGHRVTAADKVVPVRIAARR
jgi:hypothetical protein